MENIKDILNSIIEQADCNKPACRNCESYKNGGCAFGCINERVKITTPNYSCDNFKAKYAFDPETVESMKNLLESFRKVENGAKNLELLLGGKIDQKDFVDMTD